MYHKYIFTYSNILKFGFLLGLLVLIITFGVSNISFASENNNIEERFIKLSNELRCPTCQGLSVKDSEAGFSTSIKGKIRDLMGKGKSDKEIIDFFVERYGEWILRSPPMSGFNLVLWVLPGTTIVTGLLWVLYRSQKWVEKPTKEMSGITPEEEKKIIEDLERFEKT